MIFYLFLLLWVSHSVSMPASLSDVSYLTDGSDKYDATEKLNAPTPPSCLSDIIPNTEAECRRRSVNHDSWVQAEATLNSRTPANITQDQQRAADDDEITTLADNISFKMTCNTGNEAVLSMDNMWLNVGTVILDLEKGIYPMSTDWAEDLPGHDDITVWLHVDIFDPNLELVHTTLIQNMFQLIVYNAKCYGRRFTKGGSVLAIRAGQRSRKLANVSIYAVDRKDA